MPALNLARHRFCRIAIANSGLGGDFSEDKLIDM